MGLPKETGRYTYADYCTWDDDVRWELIDGVPRAMSPSPGQKHQSILGQLHLQFGTYLRGKPCKVFLSPADVRLNPDGADDTVVQPDLFVVCDHTRLDGRACVGPPDLVIEILSPSTMRYDYSTKLHLYKRAGVREYWIVDPASCSVQVFLFQGSSQLAKTYTRSEQKVPVGILPGFAVDLTDVFE